MHMFMDPIEFIFYYILNEKIPLYCSSCYVHSAVHSVNIACSERASRMPRCSKQQPSA